MVFRCKRYRICEVTRNVPRRWHVERVFVVQRRVCVCGMETHQKWIEMI